jgi:simple sugar transport system ATP-binding protein
VHNFTVLENIILGEETIKRGFLEMEAARKQVSDISKRYGLEVEPDAVIGDITVGMQQRVEILKMLYRENDILIFDEPTAVLTPQEITELMKIMKELAAEGKSVLFITHKLNEIKAVADRCTVLRKGRYIGTVEVAAATPETLSEMMVGRKVSLEADKPDCTPGEVLFEVKNLTVRSKATHKAVVDNVSFTVREGEIVCIAGIDGNGQSELVYAITGLTPLPAADTETLYLREDDISHEKIRERGIKGMAHIPEDRHRYGLVLDYNLSSNLVLQNYYEPRFQNKGFLRKTAINGYANKLIGQYDIRSGQGAMTVVRSMSGGNQQKTIIAREMERNPKLLVAVQPTRGLDVGAIEYIHSQLIKARGEGKGILLVSLELEEVLNISDRVLVICEGRIVAEIDDPKSVSYQEIGLYMSGSKSKIKKAEGSGGE